MKVKCIIVYALIISCGVKNVNAQDSWTIDSTRIVFHISNAGLNVEGTMAGIKGNIKFSKNKLSKSSFTATASPETIQTGIKLRDKHLKKVDYFDVGKYPTIQITSKQIIKSKDGFESQSTVTLKGRTKELTIPFTFSQTNDKAEFKGSFSLNRLDFGLGEKSIILSETVEIEIWIGGSLAKN